MEWLHPAMPIHCGRLCSTSLLTVSLLHLPPPGIASIPSSSPGGVVPKLLLLLLLQVPPAAAAPGRGPAGRAGLVVEHPAAVVVQDAAVRLVQVLGGEPEGGCVGESGEMLRLVHYRTRYRNQRIQMGSPEQKQIKTKVHCIYTKYNG